MTLLNTIMNLAGIWPSTMALWLVDTVSLKDCEGVVDFSLDIDTLQELQVCVWGGGGGGDGEEEWVVGGLICIVHLSEGQW